MTEIKKPTNLKVDLKTQKEALIKKQKEDRAKLEAEQKAALAAAKLEAKKEKDTNAAEIKALKEANKLLAAEVKKNRKGNVIAAEVESQALTMAAAEFKRQEDDSLFEIINWKPIYGIANPGGFSFSIGLNTYFFSKDFVDYKRFNKKKALLATKFKSKPLEFERAAAELKESMRGKTYVLKEHLDQILEILGEKPTSFHNNHNNDFYFANKSGTEKQITNISKVVDEGEGKVVEQINNANLTRAADTFKR